MKWSFCFLLVLGGKALANRMTGFEIRHCAGESCYLAKGEKSYLTFGQDSLSSSDARLEILKRGHSSGEIFQCASLNYDLITQLLICDNQTTGRESLSISSQFNIQKFN